LPLRAGIKASVGTIWSFLDRCGLTFKKSAHAAERDRPDILKRREAWSEDQLELDPSKLVFIDETGAATTWRGCGPASRKAIGKPPPSWPA
jgi:hypothetical protein